MRFPPSTGVGLGVGSLVFLRRSVSIEATFETRCLRCGRVVDVSQRGDRERALVAVLLHMELVHDSDVMLLVEGADFQRIPAPMRCDLCVTPAEPPWWNYVTVDSPSYATQDPAWLVCENCHDLVQRHDLKGLVERSVREQLDHVLPAGCMPESQLRAHLQSQHEQFLAHVQAKPTREWK